MTEIKTALTIGGSDPSGCGGIQGDIKVFSSYGVYGMSVITAVTSQNSSGVSGIAEAPASLVAEQFQSVYDDIKIDSLKIGMLSSSDNLTMVSQILGELNLKNIVLDPVFLSSDGTPLLDADAIKTMVELLLPLVEIITPNLDEASKLAGMNV
ncbi:MAG: hydroxymethylpyrimidine/phosphomethylpyrimidine kinase, partial [Proteobacteria bacterium]|nr:hydroxymethylpyrimidine/phosphomethylpyrimidine kinase [Pseudomonadota bacterium]